MKALEFRKSIPRYALLRLLGGRCPRGLYAKAAPLSLREMPPKRLPTAHWVRVRPGRAGICGSDLATICAKGSPYLAPITSMPFVLGHEVVGAVTEVGTQVRSFAQGDRVVLQPALGCRVRGIDPPCRACADGQDALCSNVMRGDISSGIQTGYCRDTGGGFSEGFVAHESQLYRVPEEIDDAAAVLVEPFACALHGVLRTVGHRRPAASLGEGESRRAGTLCPGDADTKNVLVIGCGAIGLLTIAALRAVGSTARILAVAKYDHQRALATEFGANELLGGGRGVAERYAAWAKALDTEVLDPELGKPAVIGGADVVFDCIASSQSIDDGLRFTRSGGTFVLVGMPGIPKGIDWTPMWYKELNVHAAYAYGTERWPVGGEAMELGATASRTTFDIAIELMRTWQGKVTKLLGQPFELADYRGAITAALSSGETGVAKTTFVIP